jgi:hypothetical protein
MIIHCAKIITSCVSSILYIVVLEFSKNMKNWDSMWCRKTQFLVLCKLMGYFILCN